jgi:hypothetical protein
MAGTVHEAGRRIALEIRVPENVRARLRPLPGRTTAGRTTSVAERDYLTPRAAPLGAQRS